jgi:hypothetical protein
MLHKHVKVRFTSMHFFSLSSGYVLVGISGFTDGCVLMYHLFSLPAGFMQQRLVSFHVVLIKDYLVSILIVTYRLKSYQDMDLYYNSVIEGPFPYNWIHQIQEMDCHRCVSFVVFQNHRCYLVCTYSLWFIWLLRSTWVCGDLFLKLFDMMLGFLCDEAGSNYIVEILWNMTWCTNSPSKYIDKKGIDYYSLRHMIQYFQICDLILFPVA